MWGAVEEVAVKECVSFVVSTPFLVKEYVDKLDDDDGSDTSGVCANVVVRGSTTAGLYCVLPACCWTPADCCFSCWPLPANCCEDEPGGASPKYSTCSLLIFVQPLMKRCMVPGTNCSTLTFLVGLDSDAQCFVFRRLWR